MTSTPTSAPVQDGWTEPPARVAGHLAAVAAMWQELPQLLPKMIAAPDDFFDAEAPIGAIARRLAAIPRTTAPQPSADGEVEVLAGTAFTHHFTDAPGDGETVRWHYVESGPADAEPVIFLHGVPDSWFQWHLVMAAISDRYRCIAVDLKGYGQSGKRTGDYRQEGVADQLIALLDTIGVDRFSLVTHDRGTPPADHLVAKVPDRVVRYGRGQQHLWHLHPTLHPQELMFTAPTAPFVLEDARTTTIVAYTALGAKPVDDELLVRTIAEFSYPGINTAVPRYFNSSSFRQEWVERRTRLMPAWRCPVLLLQGRDDPGQPYEFYRDPAVLAMLPEGSGLHLLDAGHFWPFEAPAEAAEVIRGFLDGEN
ncbi:alpha/beta fold hydrolase [Amycolatopsis endophytica]|uniref:Pimeloyl-ACP methyl ester carboxylesterase n=1 Tax=Amycolatopsis endophytica TaxID=860233 RepID=A0A853BA91_9PSEU|nr:alpha/beta hydrolase [Amycolatopsis endophytica]NYI91601.1 pimeloyl-ACP methyl ester carboxylesterase [Amycolatopsis endophytica]